jgi:putative ABC transport system ATP-binding protein
MPIQKVNKGADIQADGLSRIYRMGQSEIRAVNEVTFSVMAGEFVALLGTSGSGKSSLLNLIAGLDTPTGGSVSVAGRDLARMSRDDLARYRRSTVGMVFQAFNLVTAMTVLENVELPMRFAEVPREYRMERARRALERVGLGQRLEHRPSELSGGEQQRASLARALVNSPSLLLADEPTGNLDSRTGSEIMDLIHQVNVEGTTVLMVTHERPLAERYATRFIFLRDGKLVEDPAEVSA